MKIFISIFLMFSTSMAQWGTESTLNNPICNEVGGQRESCLINNGSGEIIIAWRDYRNEPILGGDIYGQKIKISDRTLLWTAGGIKVNTQGVVYKLILVLQQMELGVDICLAKK